MGWEEIEDEQEKKLSTSSLGVRLCDVVFPRKERHLMYILPPFLCFVEKWVSRYKSLCKGIIIIAFPRLLVKERRYFIWTHFLFTKKRPSMMVSCDEMEQEMCKKTNIPRTNPALARARLDVLNPLKGKNRSVHTNPIVHWLWDNF